MPHDISLKRPGLARREIPHTVSPGLWTLAWRRLKSDRVGMVSLGIVGAFIIMMILSGFNLIASDWSREVGVNYAAPSFIGADIEAGAPAAPAGAPVVPPPAFEWKTQIVDPIGDVIAELKAGKTPSLQTGAPAPEEKSVD